MIKLNNAMLIFVSAAVVLLPSLLPADDTESTDKFDKYKIIYEQNIFSKYRYSAHQNDKPEPGKKRVVLTLYVLKGIANDSQIRTAFVEEEISGTTFKLAVGGEILDGKVTEIAESYVVFEEHEESRNILIGQQFGGSETTIETYDDFPDDSSSQQDIPSDKADTSDISGDADDILNQMLQRRQRELGN